LPVRHPRPRDGRERLTMANPLSPKQLTGRSLTKSEL
jgi:hypothetical protein